MMIVENIRALKQAINEEVQSFKELLEKANEYSFPKKENILEHFQTINIKEKGDFIHLIYNKHQMFKRSWDDFYKQTRGLVIDWKKEEVVCYPFDKFFELDEHKSTRLSVVKKALQEAKYIEITEKIDGSLLIGRYYNEEFVLASSGSLEGLHVDIAHAILEKSTEMKRFVQDHKDYTVIFEMRNTEYPQLIKYGENSLTIIGMRDMRDYRLLNRNEIVNLAKGYDVKIVQPATLTLDEILAFLEDPNVNHHEGYILRMDDLLVKMKTKNFIMANRFAGEPARNFNMVIEAFLEGRVEAIRSMIRVEFLESYDLLVDVIGGYIKQKKEKITAIYHSLPKTDSKHEFVKEAQKIAPKEVKPLLTMKDGHYQLLAKDDIKFLKKYQNYFSCVSHIKYAKMEEINQQELVQKLENGDIQYLKKFEDSYTGETIYIIHKWQWLNREEIMY